MQKTVQPHAKPAEPMSLHGTRDAKSHAADARAVATATPKTPSHDLSSYRKDKPC